MAKKGTSQKNKKTILFRYGLLMGSLLIVAIYIIIRLFFNTYVNAEGWNQRAEKEMNKRDTINPIRGKILSDNGNILACNVEVFDIQLDANHPKLSAKALNEIPAKEIEQFGDSLDKYYPRVENFDELTGQEREEKSWKTRLRNEFHKKNRNSAIFLKKGGTLDDFERIKHFPFAVRFIKHNGTKNPFYYTERTVRVYPFGEMAELSIGRTTRDSKRRMRGYSGLERDLDSLLYGKPGIARKVVMTNGIKNWTDTAAVRGYDVFTTINIDMQDMLEEELKRTLIDSKATWGVAILMEVETGDIKAISNVEKLDDGTYGEAMNRAVLGYEPGSVMKPISMMIAFEDGLVKSVNDVVDCSPFQATSDPHAPTVKTMKQVIEMSSNTGIARVIFRKYANKPEGFKDRLREIGFLDKLGVGIPQERPPYFPDLLPTDSKGNKVTMTARHLSLARQAYGYNSTIPPLYTLAMYNAIANDGKFVRPRLVKGLRDENGRDSIIPVSYVRERVCSPETARKVRECMREVVVSKHGTGHVLEDDRVAIAGKTGTAFPVDKNTKKYDLSMRRLAFAGFFPYDNPKYSCMVLIAAPAGCGAARTSGNVLKNMALRLYSRGLLDNSAVFESTASSLETLLASTDETDYGNMRKTFNLGKTKRMKTASVAEKGKVPDVRGYDASTAIRMLESRGLNVRLKGAGRVSHQSIAPGAAIKKGSVINLELKI